MDDGKQNTSLYCISSLFWNSLFLIPVLLIIQQIERLKDRIWCLKTGLFFEQLFGVLPSHLTPKDWFFMADSLRFFSAKPLSFSFQMVSFTWHECNICWKQAYFLSDFLESYRVTWLRRVEFLWRNPWVFFAKPKFFSNGLFYLKWMQYLLKCGQFGNKSDQNPATPLKMSP